VNDVRDMPRRRRSTAEAPANEAWIWPAATQPFDEPPPSDLVADESCEPLVCRSVDGSTIRLAPADRAQRRRMTETLLWGRCGQS